MFNNNESSFDPSFKHSSKYSQTAARYGKQSDQNDVEAAPGPSSTTTTNWAASNNNLMNNAPAKINTGRTGVASIHAPSAAINSSANFQHHRKNYGTNTTMMI